MKGCLKFNLAPSPGFDSHFQHHNEQGGAHCHHSPTTPSSSSATDAVNSTTSQAHTRKCVAFCAEGSETVYPADEWDRTPAEPARKLSYQDLLELKEIQRSLPLANQPSDIITGRPGKQFLVGVPIVLLPLLSSSSAESGEHSGAQEAVAKKSCYSADASGRPNGSGTGWGPPSLTRQAQTTPAPRPPFPFPPRPVPFSAPASKTTFTSASTSPSTITPLRMNFQSPNKTGFTSTPPSSPTSPYPSSYPNRPSTTSTTTTYPYSSFHQQPQVQTQSRATWTPPPSLSHLITSLPIKPREKPKFEFIALLDHGTGDHHDDEHDLEDHDLVSVTSSSSCPSLCTSSCPSCSASEVDTDHEHEIETEGRPHSLKGFSANSSLSSCFPSPSDRDVGLPLADEVERHKTIKKKPERKGKERKFILVNDMEIELDDSGSESEEQEDLSGRITSTNTSTTREITTTTTTTTMMTNSMEKTSTTVTTTTSSESPSSPRSIMAPVPVKSTLWGSQSSSSASLITPPTTPPSERCGSRSNKSLNSPSSSPTAGRGKVKKIGHAIGSSTSRERSGSMGSDTSDTTSPSRNAMTAMCLPVKFKRERER